MSIVESFVHRKFILDPQVKKLKAKIPPRMKRNAAVLNGPCPCGSSKPARLCCFNGRDWHKPPPFSV
jgi:hypothetical protein